MSEYVKPKTNPYVMDFCLCIDGSAAMSGMMDTVKQQVKTIRDVSVQGMRRSGQEASDVRVKVIVFRDYACDGDAAMVQSEFFDLNDPDGQEAFNRFVDGIEACGGSGSPNALEAISLALRSDWKRIGGRFRRQIVILFTASEPLPLQDRERAAAPNYPEGIPQDLADLHAVFDGGDPAYAPDHSPRHCRLVIYAPLTVDGTWYAIKTWERTWVIPVQCENGVYDIDIESLWGGSDCDEQPYCTR